MFFYAGKDRIEINLSTFHLMYYLEAFSKGPCYLLEKVGFIGGFSFILETFRTINYAWIATYRRVHFCYSSVKKKKKLRKNMRWFQFYDLSKIWSNFRKKCWHACRFCWRQQNFMLLWIYQLMFCKALDRFCWCNYRLNCSKRAEITYLEGNKQQTRYRVTYLEVSK